MSGKGVCWGRGARLMQVARFKGAIYVSKPLAFGAITVR